MSSDIVERLNACRNGLFWPEARDAIDRIEALEKDRAEWKALAAEFQELTRGWEARSEALQAELAKAREALEDSQQALNDWVVTYASDMCGEKTVQEAKERINGAGGTLAYIAGISERNRIVLQQREGIDE